MTNLLDQGIDYHRNMSWTRRHSVVRYFIPAQYNSRNSIQTYGQYHRPIDSPEQLGCNRPIAGGFSFPQTFMKEANMDHNEAVRKFEH
jgi:hypothetical protein